MKYKPFANKYERYGAYHWNWYKSKKSYKNYADFIKQWVKEKNVIDIGAGDGFIAHFLGIRGVDNEQKAIDAAKTKGVDIDLGDAYALPYKDEKFDAVLMSHTLEHLEFPLKALTEARRILKKHIYIVAPRHEGYFSTNESKLKRMVESVGFVLTDEMTSIGSSLYAKFLKK